MKRIRYLLTVVALSTVLAACGESGFSSDVGIGGSQTTNAVEAKTAKGSRDNSSKVLKPEASGTEVYSNDIVKIDVSNSSEGYAMVSYSGDCKKVRMLIETPAGNTYNYLMDTDGSFDVYPFSEGSGNYKIGVYENVRDDQYSVAFSQSVTVKLNDEYTVFLYPNSYVNFDASSKAVAKAKEIAAGCDDDLQVVESVYHYVAKNITYDHEKAETVQSGYIPVVDETLATNKGICFDYASLMGAMLRSQRIPTRLEIGYAGKEYHAWISVYIKDKGWIDDVIQFDGKTWKLMDPTLASYANKKTIEDHMKSDTYYQIYYKY